MCIPGALDPSNWTSVRFSDKTRFQLVWVQLVATPFGGSAGLSSPSPGTASAVPPCSAGRTAWLHREPDQENDLDFFFASLFLSLKLCNYSIT